MWRISRRYASHTARRRGASYQARLLGGEAPEAFAPLRRDLLQPVNDPPLGWHGVVRKARPGTAREFADIDVAALVDRDAVRRGELARRDARMWLAEPRQQFVVLCRVD